MNKNKILLIILLIVLVSAGVYFITLKPPRLDDKNETVKSFDHKNSTLKIEGEEVTLRNGRAEIQTGPGETETISVNYFGNESRGDLNKDNQEDIAFLVTTSGGGSGIFYYAVVAIKTAAGYTNTNAFFIGDRIAPQPTEINSSASELLVNYADRKPGEPMTAQPSIGATKILRITPDGKLVGLMQ